MIKKATTIATLLLSLVSQAQSNPVDFNADIRGRNCSGGSGICSISQGKSSGYTMKNFSVTKETANKFIMGIEINNLSIEDQKLCFGKEYSKIAPNEVIEFLQDQDFVFDINTLLYLGLDPAYRLLKRGAYPLQIVNGKVFVTLTLSQL